MQGTDPGAAVTGLDGFLYSPINATDPFFQMPLIYQPTVGSEYESPVGTGRMVNFPQTNFSEMTSAELEGTLVHAIRAVAGNQVFTAYSDLNVPVSGLSTMDPKAKTLNPFGIKPFGFYWQANLPVLQGEICCPPTPASGNGHTYQAQNSGTTGATAPAFPTGDGATVDDNGIIWQEQTIVIANRLPPPASPVIAAEGAGSGLPANKDVYVVITLVNAQGESLASVPVFATTVLNPSIVAVLIPSLASMMRWIQNLPSQYVPTTANVYAAIVAHGSAAPPLSSYLFINSAALGGGVNIAAAGSGNAPPTFNSARVTPGQLPTPTTSPDIQRVPAGSLVPPPGAPSLTEVPGAGSTLAGGYYVTLTLVNAAGQTSIGGISYIVIASGSAIQVNLASSYGPSVTGVNVWFVGAGGGPTTYLANASPEALGSSPQFIALGIATALPPNTAALPSGGFTAGRDVYVAQTFKNANGETPLGPTANAIINTNANDAVFVQVQTPTGPDNEQLYSITQVGIYEADVPTGSPAPPPSAFALVGYFNNLATPFILDSASGPNPPITNGTGPGGAIAADTTTGGPNGTQGMRYAACMWMNQIETVSGFTLASVVSTIIDEGGWEIGVFNLPIGMPNVIARIVALTVADGVQAGPFNWIGLVDIDVPAQNIVYPQQTLVDQVEQSATVFLDNTTTQGTFNFTDTFLLSANNVDDRLRITIPPQGVRVDYLEGLGRLAISGVPGLNSGVYISLGGEDFESFYGDTSPVPISSAGDRCFGITDRYKGIPFVLMASGGFTLSPNTGDPSSWSPLRRWGGIDQAQQLGPCGFRAWSACGKFIIFAHRTGLYKYDMADPDMMSKEVPKRWAQINWAAAETICVTIDEDTHTVRVLVPTGESTVPNAEYVLSYIEGWNNPIHFSTFSGKEISMDAARRWSFNMSVSAFVCARLARTLPPGGQAFLDGPTFETLPDSSFGISQLLYADSAPDGGVQARTPGVFSDNGGYIDYQYETMSTGMMQAVCKPEGFNLNAAGGGTCIASFIASRAQTTDTGGDPELVDELEELFCDPIPLTARQISGITRKVPPSINEFWRLRFVSNAQPGDWVSLKAVTVYVIPFTSGRDPGDR
jgi:hypothetical protein